MNDNNSWQWRWPSCRMSHDKFNINQLEVGFQTICHTHPPTTVVPIVPVLRHVNKNISATINWQQSNLFEYWYLVYFSIFLFHFWSLSRNGFCKISVLHDNSNRTMSKMVWVCFVNMNKHNTTALTIHISVKAAYSECQRSTVVPAGVCQKMCPDLYSRLDLNHPNCKSLLLVPRHVWWKTGRHLFNGLFSRKVKPIWILMKQRWRVAVASVGPCTNHFHFAPER